MKCIQVACQREMLIYQNGYISFKPHLEMEWRFTGETTGLRQSDKLL
jgi:hypothetical protein